MGATSAIAEHCARLWVWHDAADLMLIGRDDERLRRVADDLAVRSPASRIECLSADFTDDAAIERVVAAACTRGKFDVVLIAHGALPDQAACQSDLRACHNALTINGVSPALFAEAFVSRMHSAGPASVVLIGSVAGDRGRQGLAGPLCAGFAALAGIGLQRPEDNTGQARPSSHSHDGTLGRPRPGAGACRGGGPGNHYGGGARPCRDLRTGQVAHHHAGDSLLAQHDLPSTENLNDGNRCDLAEIPMSRCQYAPCELVAPGMEPAVMDTIRKLR